ncbi:MAG: sigma-70 family RNA polymerase sigma factor [Nevskia sp.]|jgi:RNA polymerase sigma factor for flagellar operon FliA|nr:sigma-70 family RNA polymerase sigma factor [Nevskia sp.]MCK9383363.1 sigma-70 family RNA polymerase sigma factor [Nevskia sp.]
MSADTSHIAGETSAVATDAIDAEERTLWGRWRAGSEQSARGELVDRYMDLVRILAAEAYRSANFGYVEFSDLMQLGAVGLLESIDRFDPAFGSNFAGYARKRIRGAILDGLEKQSEHHSQSAFRRRVRKERTESLADGAKADHGNLFLQMVEIATGLAVGHMLEGTTMYVDPDAEKRAYSDNGEVYASAQSFRYLLSKLPVAQAKVLESHYLNGIQFDEIAALMAVSKGRISQLHSEAIRALRRQFRARGALNLSI